MNVSKRCSKCRVDLGENALEGLCPKCLLADGLDFPLVATSGNRSEEPICTDEREVVARLGGATTQKTAPGVIHRHLP